MRKMFKAAITATLAMLLLGMGFVSRASAQCGVSALSKVGTIQLQSLEGVPIFGTASFLEIANHGPGIVGFWKVKFIAEGNTGGPPDGTVIDNGFAQWHSDGTEIMNSSKPPITGNFCLGVWQKSGPSSYQLNHFALGFDSSSNFIGPVQIQESVTVNHKADQYAGTFTIDQFDPAGNPLPSGHVAGNVTATRVTVDTPVGDVL